MVLLNILGRGQDTQKNYILRTPRVERQNKSKKIDAHFFFLSRPRQEGYTDTICFVFVFVFVSFPTKIPTRYGVLSRLGGGFRHGGECGLRFICFFRLPLATPVHASVPAVQEMKRTGHVHWLGSGLQ